MVQVKILSGLNAGQVNLVQLTPNDLRLLAERGWRWEVDYKPLSDQEDFEWGRIDLMMKVFSSLRRGGELKFLAQTWRAPKTDMETVAEVLEAIEDHVSTAGPSGCR